MLFPTTWMTAIRNDSHDATVGKKVDARAESTNGTLGMRRNPAFGSGKVAEVEHTCRNPSDEAVRNMYFQFLMTGQREAYSFRETHLDQSGACALERNLLYVKSENCTFRPYKSRKKECVLTVADGAINNGAAGHNCAAYDLLRHA